MSLSTLATRPLEERRSTARRLTAQQSTARRSTTRRSAARRQWWGWLFVSPFLVVFVLFLVAPLIYAGWMSLWRKGLVGKVKFTGLGNYVTAFTDPVFLHGLTRVGLYVLVMVPIQIGLGAVIALILDVAMTRLARVSRLLIFLPYAVPAMVGALMWGFLYSPLFGPLGQLFGIFGASAPTILSPDGVFGGLVNVVTWQWVGYYMIIIYSALRAVDPSLYEAATLDGASNVQISWHIKLPLIVPSMIMCTVFSLIGTLQFYTEPMVLRSSAQSAIPSDYTPNMYAASLGFNQSRFNYASTISFSLGVIVFIGSYIFLFLTRKRNGLR
ncbi:MAG: sugar ABC transporter permease [Propionibacteriaceae bacterium]|jgi:multiple sugar transport system permease protein|nr:sugar ABC transporter permease [Propionibacteriaceae bacterium]